MDFTLRDCGASVLIAEEVLLPDHPEMPAVVMADVPVGAVSFEHLIAGHAPTADSRRGGVDPFIEDGASAVVASAAEGYARPRSRRAAARRPHTFRLRSVRAREWCGCQSSGVRTRQSRGSAGPAPRRRDR